MAPADVSLGVFQLLLLAHALAHFMLVQARLQHCPGFGTVPVLAAVVLALDHDARWRVGQPDCRIGLVDVLATSP